MENTMSNTKHTPLPWLLHSEYSTVVMTPGRAIIADTLGIDFDADTDRANAAFIVRACNSHEQMVAALREIENHLDGRMTHQADNPNYPFWNQLWDIARAALAAAEAA
jgi:hypothetical protein